MEFGRSLSALLFGTLSIAALHAIIPSHWFAFAIVARAQKWTMRQALTITALAGTGHILMTVTLGMLLAGAGKALLRHIPPQLEHGATSLLLILLGVYFAWPTLRGSHGCHHGHHEADKGGHEPGGRMKGLGTFPTVTGALVMGMTLSPCLDLLSVYVAAASFPWYALVAISLLMTATTLSLMLLLVWATLKGLQHLNLHWLERNEGLVVGGLLVALGILLFFL